VSCGDGNDSVFAGNGQDSVTGDAGNDTLNGDGGTDTVRGGDGNDSMRGGEFNDLLVGDAGDDTLIGNGGDDTLIGVTGFDQADGGPATLDSKCSRYPVDDPVPRPRQPLPPRRRSLRWLTHRQHVGNRYWLIESHDRNRTVTAAECAGHGHGRVRQRQLSQSPSAGAPYDPLGAIGVGDTTFDSEVYFRPARPSEHEPRSKAWLPTDRAFAERLTRRHSTSDIGALHFALTNLWRPSFDLVTGARIGSLLTQSYRITNTGVATSGFDWHATSTAICDSMVHGLTAEAIGVGGGRRVPVRDGRGRLGANTNFGRDHLEGRNDPDDQSF